MAPVGRDCPLNIFLPTMQTNDWIMAGVKFAFTNRKEGKYNKTECQEYLATMGIAEKNLTTSNQNLDLKMKMQILIQTSQICIHIFGKQSINQIFYQCTYALARTRCIVGYHFGIAQVPNIKEQGNRI